MYSPKDLLKLYVYGYLNGIRSSRNLATQSSQATKNITVTIKDIEKNTIYMKENMQNQLNEITTAANVLKDMSYDMKSTVEHFKI